MNLAGLVGIIIQFYSWLLFGYVLLSWIPAGGVVTDVRAALAIICEPYLSIFRRIIPPVGMMDISPIVAFLVLNALSSVLVRLLVSLGL